MKAGLVTVPCSGMLEGQPTLRSARSMPAPASSLRTWSGTRLARMDLPLDVVLVEEAGAELQKFLRVNRPYDTRAEDNALILYTSGTTKDPKGVTHTHAYTWASRLQAEQLGRCPPRRPRVVHGRDGVGEIDLERPARPVVARGRDGDPRRRVRRAALRASGSVGCDGALPERHRVPADGRASIDGELRPRSPSPRGVVGGPLEPEMITAFREVATHDARRVRADGESAAVANGADRRSSPGRWGRVRGPRDRRDRRGGETSCRRTSKATSRCEERHRPYSPDTSTEPPRSQTCSAASGT